jgi:hypothetical protein
MENQITIAFTRTEAEAKRIFFGIIWLKQVIPNILISLLLVQPAYLVGTILGVAVGIGLGLGDKSYTLFTVIMTVMILNYFFAPVYKLFFLYQRQLKEIYGSHPILNNIFTISNDTFRYENETFCIETQWSNAKMIKIGKDYLQFQTIVPNIHLWIPNEKVPADAKAFILSKISNRKIS